MLCEQEVSVWKIMDERNVMVENDRSGFRMRRAMVMLFVDYYVSFSVISAGTKTLRGRGHKHIYKD